MHFPSFDMCTTNGGIVTIRGNHSHQMSFVLFEEKITIQNNMVLIYTKCSHLRRQVDQTIAAKCLRQSRAEQTKPSL